MYNVCDVQCTMYVMEVHKFAGNVVYVNTDISNPAEVSPTSGQKHGTELPVTSEDHIYMIP